MNECNMWYEGERGKRGGRRRIRMAHTKTWETERERQRERETVWYANNIHTHTVTKSQLTRGKESLLLTLHSSTLTK